MVAIRFGCLLFDRLQLENSILSNAVTHVQHKIHSGLASAADQLIDA
jgi:hypothetical protein